MNLRELERELDTLSLPDLILLDWLISGEAYHDDYPEGEDESLPWNKTDERDDSSL